MESMLLILRRIPSHKVVLNNRKQILDCISFPLESYRYKFYTLSNKKMERRTNNSLFPMPYHLKCKSISVTIYIPYLL